MPRPFLVDTDILIDFLRGHPDAVRFVIDNDDRIVISAVTVAELYAGVRGDADHHEQLAIANFLEPVTTVPVSSDIARVGGLYRREYGRSHGVGLADAIIAATAVSVDALLKTLNIKHYPMFEGLALPYRR